MNERCVDASVILKLVSKGEPNRRQARQLVRDSAVAGMQLIAPPFFPFEIDSVVRKRVFLGHWSQLDANRALQTLDRTPILIVSDPGLRQRGRQIAEQFNERTVYDACYAALGDLGGCEFWTADQPFYDKVRTALPFVKYLPDYP